MVLSFLKVKRPLKDTTVFPDDGARQKFDVSRNADAYAMAAMNAWPRMPQLESEWNHSQMMGVELKASGAIVLVISLLTYLAWLRMERYTVLTRGRWARTPPPSRPAQLCRVDRHLTGSIVVKMA